MTREVKLALVFGFVVVLVVGVLLSDHLSGARKAQLESGAGFEAIPIAAGGQTDEVSSPVLVLIGEDGRPEPSRIEVDSSHASRPGGAASPETTIHRASSGDSSPLLTGLREKWNTAITELGQGNGPPTQAALDTSGSGPLGEPLIPANDPVASKSPGGDADESLAFRLYSVKQGDTLWSIASKELGDGSRHTELSDLNRDRLAPDGTLRIGASLKIPHQRSAPGAAAVATDTAPAKSSQTPASRRAGTYTVKRGDTLSSIAARTLGSSARYEDILAANSEMLSDEDSLSPGMVLKIPSR